MINIKSLRIGNNILSHEGKIITVCGILEPLKIITDYEDKNMHNADECNPISLDEKSLTNLGAFETSAWLDHKIFIIRVQSGGGWEDFTLSPHHGHPNFYLEYSTGRNTQKTSSMLIGYAEFVHDLQNIIYLLSGKELELA